MGETKKGVWLSFILVVFAMSCMPFVLAADYDISINESDLPFFDNVILEFTGQINQTYDVEYGSFLSGIGSFLLTDINKSLEISISLPADTNSGNYESNVLIVGNSSTLNTTFSFEIVDDIVDVTEDNFTILVTESGVWEDFFELEYLGPNGTIVFVNTSHLETSCYEHHTDFCDVQLNLKDDGLSRFMFLPEKNGPHITEAVFNYNGLYFQKEFEFNVDCFNDLIFDFNNVPNTITAGESINFYSNVSEFEGSLSYSWDFENDGVIDVTTENVTKIFNDEGTYTVNLTLTDGIQSKSVTKIISVGTNLYNVTVKVKARSNLIESAQVSIGNIVRYTNVNGTANFEIGTGEYHLKIIKERYDSFNTSLVVMDNLAYTADIGGDLANETVIVESLTNSSSNKSINDSALKVGDIKLFLPGDNSVQPRELVAISYSVLNPSISVCQLYVQQNGLQFMLKDTDSTIIANQVREFVLKDLRAANYTWKIKCQNKNHEIFSEEMRFLVKNENSNKVHEGVEKIDTLIGEINSAIVGFRKLNGENEKLILRIFEIEADLYNHKDALSSLKNKLSKINSDTDKSSLQKEFAYVEQKSDSIKNQILKNISILDSNEFIYLPTDSDVELLVNEYFEFQKNKEDLNYEKYLKESKKFQQNINIETKVLLLEKNYLGGRKEYLTIIDKTINIIGDYKNYSFFEFIPKELAESFSDLVVFNDNYNVVKSDPVLEFDLSGGNRVQYAIKKSLFTNDAEKIKSAMLGKTIDEKLKLFGLSVGAIFRITLTLTLIIISALLIWFVVSIKKSKQKSPLVAKVLKFFSFAQPLTKKMSPLFSKIFAKSVKSNSKKSSATTKLVTLKKSDLSDLFISMDEIVESAKKGDEKRAMIIYSQVENIFTQINPSQKQILNNKLTQVKHELTLLHVKGLMQQAVLHVQKELIHDAKKVYDEVLLYYKNMPTTHQIHLKDAIITLKNDIANLYLKLKTQQNGGVWLGQ